MEEKNTRDQRLIELQCTLVKQVYPIQLVEFGAQKGTEIHRRSKKTEKQRQRRNANVNLRIKLPPKKPRHTFKVIKEAEK